MPKRPASTTASKPAKATPAPAPAPTKHISRKPIIPDPEGFIPLTDAERLIQPFTTERTLRNWREKRGCPAVRSGNGGVHLGQLMQWLEDEAKATLMAERDSVVKTSNGEIDEKRIRVLQAAGDLRKTDFHNVKTEKEVVPLAVVVQAVGMLLAEQTSMIRTLENMAEVLASTNDADECRAKIREKCDKMLKVFNMNTLAKADELERLAEGPPDENESEAPFGEK